MLKKRDRNNFAHFVGLARGSTRSKTITSSKYRKPAMIPQIKLMMMTKFFFYLNFEFFGKFDSGTICKYLFKNYVKLRLFIALVHLAYFA